MIHLHGIGHFHPEVELTNAFLESLDIGTDDAWIVERVGIRTRRTVLPLDYIKHTRNADPRAASEAALYDNAKTGALAARMAMQRAGVSAEQIGMVISGGCCADNALPADATRIAAELGISAPAFDVMAGCASFGAHLHLVASMRQDATDNFILLVQPENTTRVVDYRDRTSCVLWGDGTTAAVVSTRIPARVRVDATLFASDPAGWEKIRIPRHGHFHQDGRAVQGFAIRTTRDMVRNLQAQSAAPSRMMFVGHQANLLMLEAVCRHAGIDPSRHFHNVADHGNTGAAGAPSVLSQRWELWRDGDEIAMAVVGAGLSWSAMRVTVGARA
ncbi:MAG: ketoacyl-ACP synthase III [Myxococcota bacterium]